MHSPRILFLVSPSCGILDSWLPVLWELRKKRPEVKITALFPKTEIVSEIDPSEAVIRLADSIFSEVIFKSRTGFWVLGGSLTAVREINGRLPLVKAITGKTHTALRLCGSKFGSRILKSVAGLVSGEKYVELEEIGGKVKAICFDIFVKTKKECREILEHFPQTPRFSILHGIALADYEIRGGNRDKDRVYPVTAYLYSEREVPAYEWNYGLKRSEIKVVGVPRHDPQWVQKILREASADVPLDWDKYLFVISRPAIENFFPKEEKRKALENIKKIAFGDLRCKVVVSLHPTERRKQNRDGLCEEIFGERFYGQSWVYSSAHPFLLGKKSLFGVSLYSGVAVDLLALGVPTVQVVDMKELLEKRQRKNLIMDYIGMGFVLGAGTYEEFRSRALDIINNKENVMKRLRAGYDKFFKPIEKPVSVIADDICAVL